MEYFDEKFLERTAEEVKQDEITIALNYAVMDRLS